MRKGKEMAGGSSDGGDVEDGWSRGRVHGGGTYLFWEDLTVVLPNFGKGPTRRLLQGLTGYAESGRIMAIMGPSGSGKSTLLDSLAGLELISLVAWLLRQVYYCLLGWHISAPNITQQILGVPSQRILFRPF